MYMYDDVNVHLIPKNAEAVAGYVNGRYKTWPAVVAGWPNAHKLSIAVSSAADAMCLDVEPGDATNQVAAGWFKRQKGVKPVFYTSVSNAAALIKALAQAGIMRGQYRLWTAHYTGKEHLCNAKCGFGNFQADATQFEDRVGNVSLDKSLLSDTFFGKPSPKPIPKPKPKPVPVPPKPVPPPPVVPPVIQKYLKITDKDGSVTFVPMSKQARALRGSQFAAGKFIGLNVVNEKV